MGTKFEDFIKQKKIDTRRIRAASSKIERLRPEDRAVRLKRRQLRKTEDGGKKAAVGLSKPRTGRPVTDRTIEAAVKGKPLSGAAKTRLLRAVNHLLEQKKQDAVALAALFDFPSQGNPPKKKEKKG